MHLLAENALWETISEFVTPDGNVINARGETEIIINKNKIENSDMNGFEVIIRNNHVCKAYGALYNNDELINSWNANMNRKGKAHNKASRYIHF
ncbi:hypothetical protein [Sediminispirochaeta smaragdinae]|jgi:hypothetical protein|uniref:Uncharacterized protein n=1 Tax=Sediminispirochaeta smaragdinae (strain DSM 11293 / JCM 15392 / SEBR 4228) TaxID=573413 RepID=E1R9R9_SEDSS|nr:hypothetical protein [Sediminispirochaeta smaragdinae]ADK83238.1 hypothetical protein Spirs_4160 [Sediminispirochaeta smaragdinae DSM 11293]